MTAEQKNLKGRKSTQILSQRSLACAWRTLIVNIERQLHQTPLQNHDAIHNDKLRCTAVRVDVFTITRIVARIDKLIVMANVWRFDSR